MLTTTTVKIDRTVRLFPFQREFLLGRSTVKNLYICAGLGSGKSDVLALYGILRLLDNPETLGLFSASTHKQLQHAYMVKVYNWCKFLGLRYEHNMHAGEFRLNASGGMALTKSMTNYDDFRGIEFGWATVDELCLASEMAFEVLVSRIRCNKSKRQQFRGVSTPLGYNWTWEKFMSPGAIEGYEYVHATTYDNPLLRAEYIRDMEANFNEKMRRQELLAEIVSEQDGRRYSQFSIDRNVAPVSWPEVYEQIYVGMDFNVNPMTATVGYQRGSRLFQFTEAYLEDSDTFKMVEWLHQNLRSKGYNKVTVIPDASGAFRKTSSTRTDHQILRDNGFRVLSRKKNPPVKDRYNQVNNVARKNWLTIDPSCRETIKDLDRCATDEKDKMRGHISDALGYKICHLYPTTPRTDLEVKYI